MGNYKRTSNRRLRFTEQIINEIKVKLNNGMSKRAIAAQYGISESTLRKRLKAGTVPTSLGRFKPVFSREMEEELARHILHLDNLFYGLTYKQLMSLAFQFAEENKLPHTFNKTNKIAGKKWVQQFCQRHQLSLRRPEKTSLARLSGFNKPQVDRFFVNYKKCLEQYKFTENCIYNMDETGLTTVPNKIPKIVSKKGKKSIGKVVSGERGQLVTAVCCFNAAGNYIPPALIYPRKREKEELLNGAPTGSLLMVSDSGFINTDLFLKWLVHFQKYTHSSIEKKVLLIMDNHASHISLPAINFCRTNGIILLSLPPHCSHKLQPLDRGFFGPLKTAYSQQCDYWQVSNPGKAITQFKIAELFGRAYDKVASIDKAKSSFKATGIWPFDPSIFSEEEFLPSSVTDKEIVTGLVSNENIEIIFEDDILRQEIENAHGEEAVILASQSENDLIINKHFISEIFEKATTSSNGAISEGKSEEKDPQTDYEDQDMMQEEIEPQARCSENQDEIRGEKELQPNNTKQHNKKEEDELQPHRNDQHEIEEMRKYELHREISCDRGTRESTPPLQLSSTQQPEKSYKSILETLCPPPKKKDDPSVKKYARKGKKSEILTSTPFKESLETENIKKNVQSVKRNLTGEENPEQGESSRKRRRQSVQKRNKNKENVLTKEEAEEECLVCNEKYGCSKAGEEWIQCSSCNRWAHEACSDVGSKSVEYVCDFCS